MTTSRRRHRSRPVQSEEPEQPISEPAQSEAQVEARREPEPKSATIEDLGIEFAGPLRRTYAFAVDIGLLLMLKFIIDSASGQIGFNLDPRRSIFEVAIFLAYFILPTGIFGRTIGKWVAGISVVDEEGNKPGVALAIPREAVGRFVSAITFGIGLIWVIFDDKRQGWHDKIAGTYVIIVPNSGGPGFLARMFAPQDEKNPVQNRQHRVGRPPHRRRRRNRRRR